MEHSENRFKTADELVVYLSKSALHREYRARLALEYGSDVTKKEVLAKLIDQLRKPWRHQGEETEWRAELVLENREFCVEVELLDPDEEFLPIPKPVLTAEEKKVLTDPKPKKPKKPKKLAKEESE